MTIAEAWWARTPLLMKRHYAYAALRKRYIRLKLDDIVLVYNWVIAGSTGPLKRPKSYKRGIKIKQA